MGHQDYPHRFVINGIYQLPFGKGGKWFAGANRWLDMAIGGWQFQGWFEGQSGEALGFGNAILRGNLRDIILPVEKRTAEVWFNLEAAARVFERDPAKQLGSNLRTLPSRFSFIRGAIGDIVMAHSAWDTGDLWPDRRAKPDITKWPTRMDYEVEHWYFFKWLSGDHIVGP